MKSYEIECALRKIEEARNAGRKAYAVQISENGFCTTHFVAYPREVNDDGSEYEYIYAMNEILKDINSLNVGSSMYFQPCRDDSNSKGIITRVL